MTELKKCPFCGEPVKSSKGAKNVTCDNAICFMFTNWYPVEDWQRRPLESSLQAEVDRLKEALGKIATHSMYEAQHIANEALNKE